MRMRKKSNLESRLENAGEQLLFIETQEFYQKTEQDKLHMLDFEKIFGNKNDVYLEIGCGKGTFSIELAKREKDINIIAVEKISNVIIEPVEKCKGQGITNLAFLNCGAENLRYYIKNNSIAGIYLNFSCPYPKNTYENRRLTYKSYLQIYKDIMVEDGKIYQKTDNMKFFEFSIESLSKFGYELSNISLDLHNSLFEGNIMTEYEQLFSSKNMPIYRLEAQLKK